MIPLRFALLAVVTQAHAKDAQNLTDQLADNLVDHDVMDKSHNKLVDRMVDKGLNPLSLHHASLDNAMSAKPSHRVIHYSPASFGVASHRMALNRPGPRIPMLRTKVVSAASTLERPKTADSGKVSKLSKTTRSAQKDEELSLLMQSYRGTNLNDDDTAKEGLQMRLVNVERGEDDLPLHYDPEALKEYFTKRPRAVLERAFQVSTATSGFVAKLALDASQGRTNDLTLQRQRSAELRDIVTSLGPFFIKIGQALSIRPDIFPAQVMVELQKLCDKVPSFDSKIAMQTLTDELGGPPETIFSELTPEPIAAASLGQVYKGTLRETGERVAVKVQRPAVLETVSLDLFLMRTLGLKLRSIPKVAERVDLVGLVDEFASRFYDELDYRIECENGQRIAEHMKSLPKVLIPKCYPKYTSRRVLTAEWVDGEKLAQSKSNDVQDLVNVGVVSYLTQLLGEGFFHADPHPGNMIRTPDGRLCILDFGLMTQLTEDQKYGMIEAIVHLIQRDYDMIGDDFKKLDFIPQGVDVEPIVPALTNVFNAALAGGGAKSINFNDLAADLAEITLEYPFRIPPYFALVIRAIGVLEGIALVGNPDFAIVDEAYPYISQRLLTDRSPRLRAALKYMVYGRDNVFDSERLIDMLGAFERFDVVRARAGGVTYGAQGSKAESDRMSVAMAFFFSEEGKFFRDFLLDETVRGYDVLSRNALMTLPDMVPGPAGDALRSARLLTPAPLLALVPDLTAEEERVLRSTRALLNFFLGQSNSAASAPGSSSTALQTAQRFQPVVQQYSGAMRDFGTQVVQRLATLYTERAFKFTLDVIGGRPVPPANKEGTGTLLGNSKMVAQDGKSKALPALTSTWRDNPALSALNMNFNGSWQELKYAPKVKMASVSVKKDIMSILNVEPKWDMYAKNMKLIDPEGTTLGLRRIQQLLGVVRRFIGTFIEKEDVDIQTGFLDTDDPVMWAKGTIELRGCGLPIPGAATFDIDVAGSCKIFFDEFGKVSEVDVDSWSFNGRPIKLPKLKNMESDNLSAEDTFKLLGWTREALWR